MCGTAGLLAAPDRSDALAPEARAPLLDHRRSLLRQVLYRHVPRPMGSALWDVLMFQAWLAEQPA